MLFFSFIHERKTYPCALVDWFKKYGSHLDKETGMWMVRPHFMGRRRLSTVIHLDSFLRGAHLLPVFGGAAHLPVDFDSSYSLDTFEAYFINKYADNQMYESCSWYYTCTLKFAYTMAAFPQQSSSHPAAGGMPFQNRWLAWCTVACKWGHWVVECNQLGIEVGTNLAINLRAHGEWHQYLVELACLGIFAKMPNAAKHSQLGQVMPSHAKKRVIFLMYHSHFRTDDSLSSSSSGPSYSYWFCQYVNLELGHDRGPCMCFEG